MIKKDWEKVFRAAHAKGATSCELYAELSQNSEISFGLKTCRARRYENGGAQLCLETPEGPKTLLSSSPDPENLVRLLQETSGFSLKDGTLAGETSVPPFSLADVQMVLQNALRKTVLENPQVQEVSGIYREETKDFIYANDSGVLKKGRGSFGHLKAHFQVTKGETKKNLPFEKGRTDLRSLLSDLEQSWLSPLRVEKALQKPWPAPQGDLPVLWSSACVAKVGLCLIQSLEGDLTKKSGSFLSKIKMPRLGFQVVDNWKQEGNFDVEGVAREPVVLVEQGQVRTLLCDADCAMATGLNPTGHARRQNHRVFPVVSPWEPAVLGEEKVDSLLPLMTHGLKVLDLEVVQFHPSKSEVTVLLTEAALIHNGELGEWIEPLQFTLPLPELLRSFKVFSSAVEPHPLFVHKGGQELFVELSAPSALSPEFPLPGTVPAQHYW